MPRQYWMPTLPNLRYGSNVVCFSASEISHHQMSMLQYQATTNIAVVAVKNHIVKRRVGMNRRITSLAPIGGGGHKCWPRVVRQQRAYDTTGHKCWPSRDT